MIAAVFGTAYNRWCTARRFQRREDRSNVCQLGCCLAAEDSLEHYSRCRVFRDCHWEELGIDAEWMLPEWLGVVESTRPERMVVLWAVGAYAAYVTTNMARHTGGLKEEDAKSAFRQAVTEAVAGAPKAAAVVHEVYKHRIEGRSRSAPYPERPERAARRRRASPTSTTILPRS